MINNTYNQQHIRICRWDPVNSCFWKSREGTPSTWFGRTHCSQRFLRWLRYLLKDPWTRPGTHVWSDSILELLAQIMIASHLFVPAFAYAFCEALPPLNRLMRSVYVSACVSMTFCFTYMQIDGKAVPTSNQIDFEDLEKPVTTLFSPSQVCNLMPASLWWVIHLRTWNFAGPYYPFLAVTPPQRHMHTVMYAYPQGNDCFLAFLRHFLRHIAPRIMP